MGDPKNIDSKESISKEIKITGRDLSIPETISIATIGIILLGFFNIYIYYALYDLDITPYLEPSEIIFSFSSLFVNAILLTCFGVVFIVISRFLSVLKNPSTIGKKIFQAVLVPLIMGILLFSFGFVFGGNENIGFVLGLAEILIFMAIFVTYLVFLDNKYSFFTKLFIYFFITITYLVIRNKTEVSEIVDYKNPRFEISMNVNDSIVKSGKSFFYIGATKNSIFFWNDTVKKVKSYPRNSIKWIETKYIRKDEQEFHLSTDIFKKNIKSNLGIQ